MADRPRTSGFRFSLVDAMVLVATPVAILLSWERLGDMVGAIPMAVGHFFLFCNVFRIHRTKELIWAGICLLNVGIWAAVASVWWPGILLVQTPVTALLIAWEMRGPWYHGILARSINPRLDDYLARRL